MRQLVTVLPEQIGVFNADRVREELLALMDRAVSVLIADMTATISCDHAGAGALAWAYQQAVANGTELRLVITAPAVRRVIALSGLDRLASVFPTLKTAQATLALADVVPLPPRAASTRSATLAPPDGLRRVSRLPVARPGKSGSAQPTVERQEFEVALTRIAGGIFDARLTLQTALGQPAAALRRAVERSLEQLDATVRNARTAALGWHDHGGHGRADAGEPGRPVSAGGQPRAGSPRPAGGHAARRWKLEAAKTRERSRQLRGRSLKVAVLAAAAQDRVAANLSVVAASNPHHSAHLWTLSQAATGHATRIRQWAHDHAATG